MKRLVLDTNTLISAVGWKDSAYTVWLACVEGRHELLISPALLAEFETVLSRHKFAFIPTEERQRFLVLLTAIAELIEPHMVLDVVTADPADNRVLECAVEGKATALISRDHHLLELQVY